MGKQCQTLFFWAPKSLQMVTAATRGWQGLRAQEKAALHWPPEAEPTCWALDVSLSLRPSSWRGEGVTG